MRRVDQRAEWAELRGGEGRRLCDKIDRSWDGLEVRGGAPTRARQVLSLTLRTHTALCPLAQMPALPPAQLPPAFYLSFFIFPLPNGSCPVLPVPALPSVSLSGIGAFLLAQ